MSISSIKSSQSAQYARAARNTSASRSTGNSSAAQSAAARASRNTGSSSYNTRANQTVSQPNTSSANRDSFTSGSYVGSSKKTSQSASKTSASTKRDGFISGNSGANTNQVKKTSTNTNRSDSVNISKSKYEPKKEKQEIEAVNSILDKSIISKTIGALIGCLKDNTTYLPSDNKDDVIVRGLVFKSQEKTHWCWTATMQSFFKYNGNDMSQEELAKLVRGNTDNKTVMSNELGTFFDSNEQYSNYKVDNLNLSEIVHCLDLGQPVVFFGEDKIINENKIIASSGHSVICYGYNKSDPDNFQLLIFDPAKGRGKITLTQNKDDKSGPKRFYFTLDKNGETVNHVYNIYRSVYYSDTDFNNISEGADE